MRPDRTRLRPAYSSEELVQLYADQHCTDRFPDHRERVERTIEVGARLVADYGLTSVADLSCGDAKIAWGLPVATRLLGDFSPGHEIWGTIELTINEIPPVDLFVCCETLEHLDDPDTVLAQIRRKARFALVSTPLIEDGVDDNPEHYWAFSAAGLLKMTRDAGFAPLHYATTKPGFYTWQIWGLR